MEARSYEQIIVFDPTLSEPVLKEEIGKWKSLLEEKHKAQDVVVDIWGKRELSYTVRKHKAGAFVRFVYSTNNHDVPGDLASLLRISERVIKFQSHRIGLPARKFKGNPRHVSDSSDDDLMDEETED